MPSEFSVVAIISAYNEADIIEQVVSNLDTQATNLSAARGRILDTDFAKETATLTRMQILQQAGTAMLSQANQLPQGVLSLLKG